MNATLDALAMETEDVAIIGEVVHPIRHCLIARTPLELSEIETVVSHPQANAQCARFIRTRLPSARVLAGSSTADAVRMVAGHDGPWAALGNRVAAERYGCEVLRAGVEDVADNETRFVWLGHVAGPGARRPAPPAVEDRDRVLGDRLGGPRVARQLPLRARRAQREPDPDRVPPRRQGLGHYMFFLDFEGRDSDPPVVDGLAGAARAGRGAARAWIVSRPPAGLADLGSGRFVAPLDCGQRWPPQCYLSQWGPRRQQSTGGAGVRLAGCSSSMRHMSRSTSAR